MGNHRQTERSISRRGFLRATIGSLVALPAIGGVGVFSQERVACALTAQEVPGAPFTNEQIAKITVVRRNQMAIVAVDMSKVEYVEIENGNLVSGTIPPEAYVVGAKVTLYSRYNNKTLTLETDNEGKAIFDIGELSENPENRDIDRLDAYEFNASIEIEIDGFRKFKTALLRAHGTDVLVAPTRSIEPGDTTPYPYLMSFNEWDVLYMQQEFLTCEGNTDKQTLKFTGLNFGSEAATVAIRVKDGGAVFVSTTATPASGTLEATFEGTYLQLGAEGSFKLDTSYELVVTQGTANYVWPMHFGLKVGALDNSIDDEKVEIKPFDFSGTSSDKVSLNLTWPKWVPLVGGQKANWTNLIKTPVSLNVDPFGYAQITYTLPIYGYMSDSSKPDKGGWKRYPHEEMGKAYGKALENVDDMWDKASTGYSSDRKYGCSNIKCWGMVDAQLHFQLLAALKWDPAQGIFQGSSAAQLHFAVSCTYTANFWFGPIPALISFGFTLDAIVGVMCAIYSLRDESFNLVDYTVPESIDMVNLRKYLPTYLLDFTHWHFDYSNSGLNINVTFAPFLSLGVGIAGVASASLRGKFILTFMLKWADVPDKPNAHVKCGYEAKVELVVQVLMYTQTYTIEKLCLSYRKLVDNWDGDKVYAEADDLMAAAEDAVSLPTFMNKMRIVTEEMLALTSENNGVVTQSMEAQAETETRNLAEIMRDIWHKAFVEKLTERLVAALPGTGPNCEYRVYRFSRPSRPGSVKPQADELQAQGTQQETNAQAVPTTDQPAQTTSEVAAAPVAVEQTSAAEVASTEAAVTETASVSLVASEVSSASVEPSATTSVVSSNDVAAVASAALVSEAVAREGDAVLTAAVEEDKTTQAPSEAQSEVAAPAETSASEATAAQEAAAEMPAEPAQENLSAQEDAAAQVDADTAAYWHTGCSVRYDDRSLVAVGADGLVAQADDGFLPAPGVKDVKTTGGVRPSSDVVISTNEDGSERLVHGDPRMKVIDIRTSTNTGSAIRATCAFRIGTVNVEGVGMRSRLIMTVLDVDGSDDGLSLFAGMQRVIEFDITQGSDVKHSDLFDYDFGLAFSTYSTSAGGVEANIDQVEIVLVSGRRADGDNTSVTAAGTDLYFTYLQYYAQDLLLEDLSSVLYLQLTLPANQVLDPDGAGDSLFHNLSNINCASKLAGQNSTLLVTYLDRAAESAENVFSDDQNLVTVRPRFLLYRSDALNVDVKVPDSTVLDELLERLKYDTATVMRMTLSPEIAGYHTLTLQGQTSTYFYMLGVDAEQGVLTEAKQCPMLDSSITLVPWPEQNCFLTSFPNAEYRATEEFLQGNPDTWDRSQWVLQKAWWRATGSPLDTYVLEFEEIGPKSFNFSRFALNSSGTFIFWPEGRTGSDEHIEDDEGNDVVTGQNEPVYQIKACRVRAQEDGTLHFSDPFVAADVPHNMDTLEAVRTFDRYASFKVLSTELVESDQTITDDSGNVLPLYHAAKLWYTSVPNLQCATVVASCCTLPAVSAGGMAKFDVTIRNDGNSFLSGCHLQMFVHDVDIDENGDALRDENGNYIDHGVKPIANQGLGLDTTELDVDFAETLQASSYNPADDNGAPSDVEPDRALAPGKRSVYRVTVPIPAEWGDEEPNAGRTVVKHISFHATNPVMAEGGGLAALAEDNEPVFQQFSVEPGTYPIIENRLNLKESKSRRFTERVVVEETSSSIVAYADAPVRTEGTAPQVKPDVLPRTGDSTSAALPLGLGLAGAALAAYGKRRAANERDAKASAE